VAEVLRERIVTGELPPGARLPAEPELCVAFGVSRSTIREALRSLSSQSLVQTARGVTGGTFVARPQPERVTAMLETSLGLLAAAEEVDVAELLEAREVLEVPAARLAATRRSDEQLEALRASCGRGGGFEEHRSFHELLLETAGNRLLRVVTRPVFAVLQDRFSRDQAPRTFRRRVDDDHVGILEAVELGDPDLAAQRMTQHLRRLAVTYSRIDRRERRS